jgi:ribosomal protein S18 acetylase RimI-like enzyme
MNSFTIDFARMDDIDELCELLNELFNIEEDFTPNYEKQKKGLELLIDDENSIIFVARHKNKVIGMCSIQILISTAEGGKVALLEDLVVAKNFRNMGIGTKLLSKVEEFCRKNNLLRISLLADKDNKNALSFYKSKNYNFTNLICLRKHLGE